MALQNLINVTFCLSLLQDYHAFNERTLVVEQKFNTLGKDFFWYVSQKYNNYEMAKDTNLDTIDTCKFAICGARFYYDLSSYPEEVTNGFLKNDAGDIEKSKMALIEQIAWYSNHTLTMPQLEICLNVSILF